MKLTVFIYACEKLVMIPRSLTRTNQENFIRKNKKLPLLIKSISRWSNSIVRALPWFVFALGFLEQRSVSICHGILRRLFSWSINLSIKIVKKMRKKIQNRSIWDRNKLHDIYWMVRLTYINLSIGVNQSVSEYAKWRKKKYRITKHDNMRNKIR